MSDRDMNKQFDAIKREVTNTLADMHARKLAIPAGALLLAIVAAMVMLPKGSTPVTPPPVAAAPPLTKTTPVAQISLVPATTIDGDAPLTTSSDPFSGSGGYDCKKIGSNPDTYNCKVADLMLRVVCTAEANSAPCAPTEGSTGSTGATSGGDSGTSGGSGGSTESTGGNGKSKSKSKSSSYYVVDVSIDGSTKKDVVAGDTLPKSSDPLVVYAGTNDAHTKGIFIAGDGVTVTGVVVDQTFGSFALKKGQTATLTDATGAAHKITLKSIDKVSK
jgi:hypothetical protein